MSVYSVELTIDGDKMALKAFRALRRFDGAVMMGPALQKIRERQPFEFLLSPNRKEALARLNELLEELEESKIKYDLSANNVPRSSHLWEPTVWARADVLAALNRLQQREAEVKENQDRGAEWLNSPEGKSSAAATMQLEKVRILLLSRWDALGFENLRPSEKNYLYVWWLYTDIISGGFDQYFHNSTGDSTLLALSALQSLGILEAYAILTDVVHQFDMVGGFKQNREDRWKCLEALPVNTFEDATRRFYELTEDIRATALVEVERDYK